MTTRITLVALLGATLAPCSPVPRVGQPTSGGAAAGTFSSIADGILVPRCATSACHAGDPPPAYPRLDRDVAWSALVGTQGGQPSLESSLNLVEPGAPDQSYLVFKLRGTASSAGGFGSQMPLWDAALSEDDIAAIEAWISEGAPND